MLRSVVQRGSSPPALRAAHLWSDHSGHIDTKSENWTLEFYLCEFVWPSLFPPSGGRERSDRGDSLHHERAAGVSHLLAHLQHHGRQPVRRQVRPLCQPHRPHLRGRLHQQQVGVRGAQRHLALLLDQSQGQLRQRGRRIPRSAASGERRRRGFTV